MGLLEGKVALVTGTNRGIGRCIAESFAREGATIYAHARKATQEFEEFITKIAEENGVDVLPIYFDCLDEEAAKSGMKAMLKGTGGIDVLVNNAGMPAAGTLRMTSMDALRESFQVNFFTPVLLMQLAASKMMRQKSGSIVNIASMGGIEARPGYLPYGSPKAALIWATRSVARELGAFNVRANAVAPGMTATDMGGAYKTADELAAVMGDVALGRMAEPEEIADVVLFLASDKSSYVTGEVLRVNGGRA